MVQSWYGGWTIWVYIESAWESHIVLFYEWPQNYFETKEPIGREWYKILQKARTANPSATTMLAVAQWQMSFLCKLDRLFLHAARPGWNPGGAAPQGRWLSTIHTAWESWWLQVWGWHICLRWLSRIHTAWESWWLQVWGWYICLRWLSRIHTAWESWWLQVWGWHICLSWTCIQCHSE